MKVSTAEGPLHLAVLSGINMPILDITITTMSTPTTTTITIINLTRMWYPMCHQPWRFL
jgi:hypothetical protein